jgi:Endonuclease/Exonuclease/phosphatase family
MSTNLRTLARHLKPQPPPSKFTLRELLGVKKGKLSLSAEQLPLSLMTQNMGLVTFPVGYLGTNRAGAVKEIIAHIKALSPDVVGLCEVFADDEIAAIRFGLRSTHPFCSNKLSKPDLVSDGGCYVFSKHKILAQNQFIFTESVGGDWWADKGVVHLRIQPPTAPRPLEIFYSHTQNIEVFGGTKALYAQIIQMGVFIQTHADLNNPIFIMGDLNVPGELPDHHAELIRRLNDPVDLWLASGHSPTEGRTFVSGNNFYADQSDNPKLNRRLDYILMRAPKKLVPIVKSMEVLKFKLDGRDLSDHFGLRAVFEQAVSITV